MRIETAALIGAGWGRMHIGALRAVEVEVVELIGRDLERARRVADEEGIAKVSTDLRELEADLIILASPTRSHAEHLRALSDRVVLMEKPVVGPNLPSGALSELPSRCFVNYAFPFVEVVRAADVAMDSTEGAVAVEVEVRLRLPAVKSLDDWLLDIASHPLAWVEQRVGPLVQVSRLEGEGTARFELQGGQGVPVRLRFERGGAAGIEYRLRWWCKSPSDVLTPIEVHGCLRLGEPWRFRGTGFDLGTSNSTDPWIAANHRCVRSIVDALRTEAPAERTRSQGLFDLRRGLFAERVLLGEEYVRSLLAEQ